MKKLTTLLLFGLLLTCFAANAQADKYKALFVYNFTKHIEWPATAKTGDFIICVVSQKELYSNLAGITNGKKVGNQNILVKQVGSIDEVTNCHIVVIGSNNSSPKRLGILGTKVGANTLIVANGSNSAERGASINFTIAEGKLKFELNKAEVTKKGLKLSTYLENLAVIVG